MTVCKCVCLEMQVARERAGAPGLLDKFGQRSCSHGWFLKGQKSNYSYFIVGVSFSFTDLKATERNAKAEFFSEALVAVKKNKPKFACGQKHPRMHLVIGQKASTGKGPGVSAPNNSPGTAQAVLSDADRISKVDKVQNYLLSFHLSKTVLQV